ncbi:hypothetical protein BJ165DRAFT_1413179 [Panaeolus papilionaceus]|nr:hypothetical protein BJ165DRAFT_1413179 [Panaeolus papilionaceus]
MSSSPPDISSLTLNSRPSQQRLHDTYDYEGNNTSLNRQYHFATTQALQQSPYNPLSTLSQSPLKKQVRSGLPTQWLDNTNTPDNRSLSPHNNSDFSSTGGSPPLGHINPLAPVTPATNNGTPVTTLNSDDEIIPTAIVIKNIPFNVKRETLLEIIASLSIPTPYAFNYHLDQQGSFRGLAFANFRQAVDADAVVAALNGFDVQGRKLRVEYKKVLQAGEKERIEREKAIRRMRSMQLEKERQQQPQYEDYGTAIASAFSPQRSFSSSAAYQQQQQQTTQYSPPGLTMPTPTYSMPTPAPAQAPPTSTTPSVSEKSSSSNELDLNDASTLEIYTRILLFKDDRMRDELAFSRTLTPKQRRVVHLIAQKLGVYHYSVGEGEERYAVVTRIDPQRVQRQPHTLSRAPSAYLTPISPTTTVNSLRVKKSMPDMKTLHQQAPRLSSRASNGNIREGYATIASPSRRVSAGFGSLFSNGHSAFAGSVPPVPSLPASIGSMNGGGHDSLGSGVVRQPRGPGLAGFSRRDSRVGASESQLSGRGGLDAQTYEPLEI